MTNNDVHPNTKPSVVMEISMSTWLKRHHWIVGESSMASFQQGIATLLVHRSLDDDFRPLLVSDLEHFKQWNFVRSDKMKNFHS
mmetsp:Transcript_12547/g.37038  ORF Transcript_12547/g.37038 Transcript_12547/m.37038 type:complete len:84 (-) Transcript_12547:256-507(-)